MNLKVNKTCGAVLAFLIILTGCRDHRETGTETRPVRVMVSRVAPVETGREFAYSGTITESETLPQSFAVTGTVTRVHVNEGDVVAKGALLAELDDTSYRQMLEMAEAAQKLVEQSEENLKVNEESYHQGICLLSDLLDAQAGLQQARSKLIDAKAGNRVKVINYLVVTGRADLARNM